MLVLSRRINQKIFLGDDITLTVVSIKGGKICLGIDAPSSISIMRDDIKNETPRERKEAIPR